MLVRHSRLALLGLFFGALTIAVQGTAAFDWCSNGVCQEWARRSDPSGGGNELAVGTEVGSTGLIYIAGDTSPGGDVNYWTAAYSQQGNQVWSRSRP